MQDLLAHANDCIACCRRLALDSEEPDFTTRTFLSEPMRRVHADLCRSMRECGMSMTIDAAGNLRGVYGAAGPDTLFIGSHLDTVPHAGAFDGILGVVLGLKLIELVKPRQLRFSVEVVGFSEEEGVRFGFPFIGSRALIGELDEVHLARKDAHGISVKDAIHAYGLDPAELPSAIAREPTLGYLEFHIEQGPVLESLDSPLGVVEAIVGQTRLELTFEGSAGHAGTTPMRLRHDALAGAAEWIVAVEAEALATSNLVATVGRIEAHPGAPNVIAGAANLTLDVRHHHDAVRHEAVGRLIGSAESIARKRGLKVTSEMRLDQAAVAMDLQLTNTLMRAVERAGHTPHRVLSGAGHDAMIVARRMPAAMLFLRSPGGLSHHPDESVLAEDVAAALAAGMNFLEDL
jgi:allantoate deiminase